MAVAAEAGAGTLGEAAGPLAWQPPSEAFMRRMTALFTPWRWYTAPRCSGLANVPTDRPFLLVGNHSLMAVLDVPLMILLLREETGLFPRSVADHVHWSIPGWRDFLEQAGVVDGTPENCRALMRAGQSILVFPGGAREVFKRHGEKYELLWGERAGFARLAIEFGYPIVPFSALGAEDAYDVVIDSDELLAGPLGPPLLRILGRADLVPPIVRGWGPTLLPRPVRFYFHFGRPVETAPRAGRVDPISAFATRERVRRSVEAGLGRLMLERARDPERRLAGRLAAGLRRALARGRDAA